MFSRLVKIKIAEKELSKQDLAASLGCSVSNLNQYLRVDNFREKSMLEFAEALNCDLEIRLTDRA